MPSRQCGVTTKHMISPQLSTTSYIKKILIEDFNLDLNSPSGKTEINHLLNRTVLLGGKRLRPLLTLLFSRIASIDPKIARVLAVSIEYVHAASLAHDDVIDGATMRRGKPSINVEGDNKMSILAGDYLLAQVINELASTGNIFIVKEMAAIIKRLSIGEWIQHDCLTARNYNDDSFHEISLNKTSSVLEWCAVSPFLYSEAGSEIITICRRFGESLGICFQLYDDLLDYSDVSEKDCMLDLKNEQLTYLTYIYLRDNDLYKDYQAGVPLKKLVKISELSDAMNTVKNMADEYHEKCIKLLNDLRIKVDLKESNEDYKAIVFLLKKLKNRKK